MSPNSAAFGSVLVLVERAKEDLVAATPSPRGVTAVPLAEALLRFEEGIASARDAMDGWRRTETEEIWAACLQSLEESLLRAERLRLDAPDLDYEGLVAKLAELIDPLEAFEDAEQRLSPES